MAVAGVLGLGAGSYFGMQSKSKYNSIEYGPGGTTQPAAERLNEDRFKTLDGKPWTTYPVTRFLSDPG